LVKPQNITSTKDVVKDNQLPLPQVGKNLLNLSSLVLHRFRAWTQTPQSLDLWPKRESGHLLHQSTGLLAVGVCSGLVPILPAAFTDLLVCPWSSVGVTPSNTHVVLDRHNPGDPLH
jgi:hypothetical protein